MRKPFFCSDDIPTPAFSLLPDDDSGSLSLAQAQPVVVVTEIRQVVKLVPAWRSVLSEESFPDYFGEDTLLHRQVLAQTGQLLQKKWEGRR